VTVPIGIELAERPRGGGDIGRKREGEGGRKGLS